MNAGLATAQEHQGSGDVVGAGIRRRRIEAGFAIQDFLLGQRNFPAKPKIEG